MKKPAEDTGKIARSAGTVSAAVMCSRVLGLIREQVFAGLFGAGFAYDSFVVAFRIPNLLRDLFAEGALSTAFVTVFSDYDANRGKEATWRLASNVLTVMAVLLSLVTLIGMWQAESLILLLAPHFVGIANKVELTRQLTVIMFPFLVFISVAAVVMGILNTKGRFFVPAMASTFFNLGSIIGGVGFALLMPRFGQPAILGMAIGTLIGGLAQLVGQLPALFKIGFVFKPVFDLREPGLLRVLKLMVPAIIGLSATQINIFVNTNFASSLVEGSVSWLNYAFRLVQFPIGVFGVAVSIATLPVIARYAAIKDIARLKETYASSLILAFSLTIPATVGLCLLAEPIIRLIFEHGAFTAFDTTRTAEALSYYSVGLFAYAAVKITVPVFYALNDTRYPVMGSFLAVGANILIILLTIGSFGHRAIALSTSCAMIINFIFLSAILYRRVQGYSLKYMFGGVLKIVVASLAMAGVLFLLSQGPAGLWGHGLWRESLALLVSITLAVAVYGGVLHVLKFQEMALITGKIRERLKRK